jgi:hypothetical protein
VEACRKPPEVTEEPDAASDSPPRRRATARLPTLLGGGRSENGDKPRPSLYDLEEDFEEIGGLDVLLDVDGLAAIWKRFAERKLGGPLGPEDERLVETSAQVYHKILDVGKSGTVSYAEFAAFMMGATEPRGPLKDMHARLGKVLQRAPQMLSQLVERFRDWDTNCDGYLSLDDFEEDDGFAETRFVEMLEAADVDCDGRLDLWELLAYSMGRRKTAVELLVYDVSKGASKYVSPIVLGRHFEAIYHSSVLVYGSEFWYGGKVFMNEPPCKCFPPPLTQSAVPLQPSSCHENLKTVHLGYTFVTQAEFSRFLTREMLPKYTSDNYDVLTNNCNCFCEDVVRFLTGNSIPDEILNMPQQVMHTPGARILRPLLNRWLGGFDHGKGAGEGVEEWDARLNDGDEGGASSPPAPLAEGALVVLGCGGKTPKIAAIKGKSSAGLEVRFFDPLQSEFVAESDVPRSDLRRVESCEDASPPGGPGLAHVCSESSERRRKRAGP